MSRQVIVPQTDAPRPAKVFSPAIQAGNLLFVSGHTGSDFVTREFEPGIQAQTRKSLQNIQAIIEAAGGTLADVAKVNVYMTDMNRDFSMMNEVFKSFFPSEPPARCTVGVSHLARPGVVVEIEATAVLNRAVAA